MKNEIKQQEIKTKCACGCGLVVKKINGKFVRGHNARVQRELISENTRKFNLSKNNPRRIPTTERTCICGCGVTFVCKVNSTKRYVSGHNSKFDFAGKNNPCYRIKDKEAYKKKQSKALLGYKHSEETRRKYSAVACERVKSGKQNHTGKGEWLNLSKIGNVYASSSYEKSVLEILDKSDLVNFVVKEKVIIPYMFEGSLHNYVVDFLIGLKSGQIVLVEVKPKFALELPINTAKFKVAIPYAKERGWDFQVWDESVCFSFDSVTTMLVKVTLPATATDLQSDEGLRYSLNSAVMQRGEEKSLTRLLV